jgi:U2 small nuclear ribonucleoprotein A'
MLCNNRVASLSDLDPLSCLRSLRTLSLLHNPVSRLADYRLYVIHLLPHLHSLDFAKVKPKEREAALMQFGPPPTAQALQEQAQAGTIAALQAARQPEKLAPGQAVPSGQAVSLSTSYAQPSSFAASSSAAASAAAAAPVRLTPEELSAEKKRLVGLIAAATKLEEVTALQKQLETIVANNA